MPSTPDIPRGGITEQPLSLSRQIMLTRRRRTAATAFFATAAIGSVGVTLAYGIPVVEGLFEGTKSHTASSRFEPQPAHASVPTSEGQSNPTKLKPDESALRRFSELSNFCSIVDNFMGEAFEGESRHIEGYGEYATFFTKSGNENQKTGVVVMQDKQADGSPKKTSLILFNIPATQAHDNVPEAINNARIGIRWDSDFTKRNYATLTVTAFGTKIRKEKANPKTGTIVRKYGTHVTIDEGMLVAPFTAEVAELLDKVRGEAAETKLTKTARLDEAIAELVKLSFV